MTLQEFIDQYGSYVQIATVNHLEQSQVYNVADVVASATLFAEISSGTLTIYAAYSSPTTQVPPPVPPVPTLTAEQLQIQLNSLLLASRLTQESLNQEVTGLRNFLLAAPYFISFYNIAYPTPLFVGQLSSETDPRLTDGQADYQMFSNGTSLNLEQVQPIYMEIDGANIQATITIPMPDYAKLLGLTTLSLQLLNTGDPVPATVSCNLYVTSTVSNLSYTVPYILTATLATPVPIDDNSYQEAGLNSLLYLFQGNGIGPSGTIFHGEPIDNFEVHTVTLILTTPYNAVQTFIDDAQAQFETGTTFTPGSGSFPKYTALLGDGSSVNYTVTHNLGTLDVLTELRAAFSPYTEVFADITSVDLNNIQVSFFQAPASASISITVAG